MTTQPEALRLADELETDWHYKRAEHPMLDAAAELRRLHAENEAVHAVGIRQERELMECEAQRDELLEALKLADAALFGANMNMAVVERKAREAIARATGEQK